MEVIEVGSPDSGYRSCSPHLSHVETAVIGRTETETTDLKKKYFSLISSRVASVRSDRLNHCEDMVISNPKLSSEMDGAPNSNKSDLSSKSSACLTLSSNTNKDNQSSSIKSASICNQRHRRLVKRKYVEEISSPVLGIRILPREQVDNAIGQSNSTQEEQNTNTSTSLNKGSSYGTFTCQLCLCSYENAMALAQHKCVRIVSEKYTCSECDKTFGCPANLASHKRWHKPKEIIAKSTNMNLKYAESSTKKEKKLSKNVDPELLKSSEYVENQKKGNVTTKEKQILKTCSTSQRIQKAIYPCPVCKRRFRRDSNRRKHAHVKHQLHLKPLASEKKAKRRMESTEDDSSRGTASPDEGIIIPEVRTNNGTPQKVNSPVQFPFVTRSSNMPFVFPSQVSLKISEQKNPSSSLSTLALAAEAVNDQNDVIYDYSIHKRKRNSDHFSLPVDAPQKLDENVLVDEVQDKPLDLSLKTVRQMKLRHSIADITKPIDIAALYKPRAFLRTLTRPANGMPANEQIDSPYPTKYLAPPRLVYQNSSMIKLCSPRVLSSGYPRSVPNDYRTASLLTSGCYVTPSYSM